MENAVFDELEQRGNDWNVRAQPLRWRIEGTDAAAAFDAAMTSVIDFFNACSMIKLESEDLPHRMEPAHAQVEGYIKEMRGKCGDHYQAPQENVQQFRAEAKKIAGLDAAQA